MVTSSAQLSGKVAAKLKKEGIEIRHSRSVRDLGVEASAGKRRAMATVRKRSAKSKLRLARLSKLRRMAPAKLKHKTARLATTNLWLAASFGIVAHGIANK